MMIEIAQMAMSYYLDKLRKACFLKHGPENAEQAYGASAGQLKAFKRFKVQ